MRAWHWILAALAVVVGVAAFAIGRRSVMPNLDDEIDVIELKAEVKRIIAVRDAVSARLYVESRYAETIKRLDVEARTRADLLRADPVALSEYLYRATLD